MGGSLSNILKGLFANCKPISVLMLGLDAAGKTTILYKLKQGEALLTVPTIGFNVEEVQFENLTLTIWDMGGQDKIRALWQHYFQNVDCVVYVIDSSDSQRISENKETIQQLDASRTLGRRPFMFLANKQDLNESIGPATLAEDLGLYSLERPWTIQPACAVTGEGLETMLRWISKVSN